MKVQPQGDDRLWTWSLLVWGMRQIRGPELSLLLFAIFTTENLCALTHFVSEYNLPEADRDGEDSNVFGFHLWISWKHQVGQRVKQVVGLAGALLCSWMNCDRYGSCLTDVTPGKWHCQLCQHCWHIPAQLWCEQWATATEARPTISKQRCHKRAQLPVPL